MKGGNYIAVSDLQVKISVDLSDVQGKLKGVQSSVKGAAESFSNAGKPIKSFSDGAKSAFNGLANAGDQLKQKQSSLVGTLAKTAAGFVGVKSAADIFNAAVSRVDKINSAEKSISQLTGSNKVAKQVMLDLQNVVDGTPLSLDSFTSSAKGMIAAGMDSKKIEPVMTAIGDAAFGVGNGAESIDIMSSAFKSLQASGNASLGDLNRLLDQNIPVYQIIGNQLGKTTEETKKMISDGMLPSAKAIDLITKGIEKGTDGVNGHTAAMAGQMKTAGDTIAGAAGNIKTALVKSLAKPLDDSYKKIVSGLKGVKDGVKSMQPAIESAFSIIAQVIEGAIAGSIDAFNIMKPAISAVISVVKSMVSAFQKFLPEGTSVKDVVQKITPALIALFAAWKGFTVVAKTSSSLRNFKDALAGSKKGMDALSRTGQNTVINMNLLKNGFTSVKGVLSKAIKSPFAPVVIGIAAAIAAFKLAYDHIKPFRDFIDGIAEKVKTAWKLVCDVFTVSPDISKTREKLEKMLPAGWVDGIVKATSATRNAFQRMSGAVSGTLDVVTGKAKSVKDLDNIFQGLFSEKELQGILNFGKQIKELFESMKKAGQAMWKDLSKALSQLKKPFGELMKAMKPVVDFIKEHFIQILTVVLLPVLANLYTMFNIVRAVLKNLGTVLSGVIKYFTGLFDVITGIFTLDFKKIGSGLGKIFDGAVTVLKGVLGTIKDIILQPFKDLWKLIKPYVDKVVTGVRQWVDDVKAVISEKFHAIVDPIVKVWDDIKKAISDKVDDLVSWFDEKWTAIKTGAEIGWNAIAGFFGPIIKWIIDLILIPFNLVSTVLEGIWMTIKAGLEIAWAAIATAAGVAWGFIKDNIIQPIQSAWDWICQKFTDLGVWLSTKWEEIKQGASAAWAAFKQYIIQPVQEAWAWVKQKFADLGAWLSDKWNTIKQGAMTAWNAIKQYIIQPIQSAWQWVTQKIGELVSWISGKWNTIKQGAITAWNGVKSAIIDPIISAVNTAKGWIDKLKGFFSGLKLSIPAPHMPKLPHFSLKTGSKTILGKTITYPTGIDVNWYKTGGIATGASVVGIGEAGDEAIVPLSDKKRMAPFASSIAGFLNDMGGSAGSNANQSPTIIKDNTFIIREEADIDKIAEKLFWLEQKEKIALGKA